ncbi:MAG: sigma-70 family RNA polymerase sigma factor [Planctomycetes bacterium]|nr:sigma-70 family RNA polymerase sigma factor [Planctomycetota bacterium]
MDSADDRTLLAAAAAGDHAAIAALVARHGPLVLAACRRQLRGAEADEAAQAVFLVLWRRAARAAAAPGLPGWLVVTARHVCATVIRTAARRRQAERQAVASGDPAPLDSEARERLDEALAALPAGEREAVVRRHLLGEDPAAVAAALGCAEGTVHSRTSRGLERLRAWYARRGIACSTAALAALFAGEAASAAALPPAAVLACATPSAAATALATAATAIPILLIGVLTMVLAALALLVALTSLNPAAATSAEPANAAPAAVDERTVRLYSLTDLYYGEIAFLRTREVARSTPVQDPDPQQVALLEECRNSRVLCARIQHRVGGSDGVGFVQAGLSDADLIEVGALADVPWRERMLEQLRHALANGSGVAFPSLDCQRNLLVNATVISHARLEADLVAARALRRRHADADGRIEAAASAFQAAADAAFGSGMDEVLPPPRTPLPATLAAPGGRPYTVTWLPESGRGDRPFAVASDGSGSLYLNRRGVCWRPTTVPFRIARELRQRLDQGILRPPLGHDDWNLLPLQPRPAVKHRPEQEAAEPAGPAPNF